ncbi:squalene/phytoene synthase family protein [Magnetospirillum sp. UT-4]|uniref:squalene/phytoene synthase family protein n=1 Tax=Magnetospirillum sp. UT-4 TaxID=2681467 RepID=UPI0013824AA4|nr:squalene/phytoene synthase family protein [Magnetospirillum sp. UT-4]CAA7615964.1 putative phytoene synthase [Magnetospirillum sp. UT-4]
MSSSFYWAMRLMPRAKRDAMFALYGLCRALDDMVDCDAPLDQRRARLATMRGVVAAWRQTGIALAPALAALAPSIERYGLPDAELDTLIDGMEMDLEGMSAPDLATLRLYCRRVAGAPALLAVPILGRAEAGDFALRLAEGLQFTNILRDLAEDGDRGRLYLPAEILEQAGIPARTPRAVLTHPALPRACAAMAGLAQAAFDESESELRAIGARGLWPARAMMQTYRALLERMTARGWRRLTPAARVGTPTRLWIALRCAVAGP